MEKAQPPKNGTLPRNWNDLARCHRQKAALYASLAEHAAACAEAITGHDKRRAKNRLDTLHDLHRKKYNRNHMTCLGALLAAQTDHHGDFSPQQIASREKEANRIGHVMIHFITAAQLFTAAEVLWQNTGLRSTAIPLIKEAAQRCARGTRIMHLESILRAHRHTPSRPDEEYIPLLPDTIMRVVKQEVPRLSARHHANILHSMSLPPFC